MKREQSVWIYSHIACRLTSLNIRIRDVVVIDIEKPVNAGDFDNLAGLGLPCWQCRLDFPLLLIFSGVLLFVHDVSYFRVVPPLAISN